MRQTFTIAVGVNLIGATLPDGSPAAAVQINNASGNWLTLYPGARSCPPYTQGWIAYVGSSVVDVRVLPAGPAGQASTAAGDPVVVTLYDADEAPDPSEGTSFIDGFTAMPTFDVVAAIPAGTTVTTVCVAAVAGKRIRVRSWAINKGINDYAPILASLIDASTGGPLDQFLVATGEVSKDRTFAGDGVDLTAGHGLSVSVTAALWMSANAETTGTYGII